MKRKILLISLLSICLSIVGCEKKEEYKMETNPLPRPVIENKEYIEGYTLPTVLEMKEKLNKYEFENELDNPTAYGYEKDAFKDLKDKDTNIFGYFNIKDLPKGLTVRMSTYNKENIFDSILIRDESDKFNDILEKEQVVDIFKVIFGEKSDLYINNTKEILNQDSVSVMIPLSESTIKDSGYNKGCLYLTKDLTSITIEISNDLNLAYKE